MRKILERQVEELLRMHETEPSHVRQVARLADEIYVGLQAWHQLEESPREWLHAAALLHDIGWSLSPTGSRHHKLSAQLIDSHRWSSIPEKEVKIMAQVARYHRKALPGPKHLEFLARPPEDQKIICTLAGILRVADALDRTHSAVVQRTEVTWRKKRILLRVQVQRACQPELRAVEKKKDLLELVSGCHLVVEPFAVKSEE